MNGKRGQNRGAEVEPLSSRDRLRCLVLEQGRACNGCNRCFRACPLPPERKVEAQEVLTHLPLEEPPCGPLATFVLDCTGCGRCTTHCPRGLAPDLMLRWEKAKFARMPYPRFMRVRGARLAPWEKAAVWLHNHSRRKGLGNLAPYIDNNPQPAPWLFYFSCYLFSPTGAVTDTLWLARRLGLEFSVLGGMRHCCGYVHHIAGQLEKADALYQDLGETLARLGPQVVVTGCAECYRGLKEITAGRGLEIRVLSTEQFVLENWFRLGLPRSLPGKVAYHLGCRAEPVVQNRGEEDSLPQLADVLELTPAPGNCCGMAAAEHNREYTLALREAEVAAARERGGRLLVDCVSCREKFQPPAARLGVEVTDLASLAAAYLKAL